MTHPADRPAYLTHPFGTLDSDPWEHPNHPAPVTAVYGHLGARQSIPETGPRNKRHEQQRSHHSTHRP